MHNCNRRVTSQSRHPARQAGARTAVVVGAAVGVFWAAGRFSAEPLLACVLAGVTVTNRKRAPVPS